MSNLTILNSSVRQLDNLYSLNDLHKIAGNEDKHLPFRFMRLDQTQDLIAEIQKELRTPDLVFKIVRGRNIQGTYACKEIVIAYAAWISPQFHLVVLRAFLDKLEHSQKSAEIAPLTITPEQQQQIQNAVQATHHRTGLSYAEIYQRLKAKFHVAKYDQLRQDQHQEALSFIAGLSATMARTEIVPAEPITPSIISLSAEQVFPLIVFHSKWKKAVADLVPIYEHLKRKGDVALADIVSSHFDTLNQNTALFDQVEMTLNHCVAKMQHSEESRLLRYFLF